MRHSVVEEVEHAERRLLIDHELQHTVRVRRGGCGPSEHRSLVSGKRGLGIVAMSDDRRRKLGAVEQGQVRTLPSRGSKVRSVTYQRYARNAWPAQACWKRIERPEHGRCVRFGDQRRERGRPAFKLGGQSGPNHGRIAEVH